MAIFATGDPITNSRKSLLADLTRALEAVLSTSDAGHAQEVVPLLDAAIVASRRSTDAEVLRLYIAAQLARQALTDQRIGSARRFAGTALRDGYRQGGHLSEAQKGDSEVQGNASDQRL
jgi:hypothetical protein